MTISQVMSAQNSGFTQDDNQELEQILTDLERSLLELQERHAQVKQDYQKRIELEQQKETLKQQQEDNQAREPIKTQLRYIQQELDNLEINLESRLLNWQPFWQAVRMGGLGVIIGWLLKSWAG
ncbi:MAG: hypothetical protein QNJ34_11840 [Xenococcaceae cyanobacterium MO_188.B29]|nr:hypothetical protein [Xenococcaceae cyanobacterium MO_188.B29]